MGLSTKGKILKSGAVIASFLTRDNKAMSLLLLMNGLALFTSFRT